MPEFLHFARTALRIIAPLLAFSSLTAVGARETRWTIVELNAPSATFTLATAVNNFGEIAGWYNTPCPQRVTCERAFIWDGAFRTLPTPPDVTHVRVRGINDSGIVVGYTPQFGGLAIAWASDQFANLGFYGEATRVNDKVEIACTMRVGGLSRACMMRRGTLYDLGTAGGEESFATDLNDRGQVIINADMPDGSHRAFVWDKGLMTDLGTLGGTFTFGNSINNRGVVVGSSHTSSGESRPFKWSDGVMSALPVPIGSPSGINDRGAIIGNTGQKAWLLDDGVLTYLDDLPEVRAKGFTSLTAVDLNERGWIVGWGNTPAGQRGFLLIAK